MSPATCDDLARRLPVAQGGAPPSISILQLGEQRFRCSGSPRDTGESRAGMNCAFPPARASYTCRCGRAGATLEGAALPASGI